MKLLYFRSLLLRQWRRLVGADTSELDTLLAENRRLKRELKAVEKKQRRVSKLLDRQQDK